MYFFISLSLYIYIHKNIHNKHTLFPLASASSGKNPIRSTNAFFRNDGDGKLEVFIFKLLLRPWDLSHCVERQKLMVSSQEEMSVRVLKGGCITN